MKIEGTFHFQGSPDRVWALLQDPEAMAACLPGCQKLERLDQDRYAATLSVGIAVFKGTYDGQVSVSDQVPPRSYRLHVEGSGRPGFVKGVGDIRLEPAGDAATLVTVQGDAQVGGPVLAVGSRLVVPAAKLLMCQFFEAMQRRLTDRA